jgi:hypothetical protein
MTTRTTTSPALEALQAAEADPLDSLTTPELSRALRVPEGTLRHWRLVGYGPRWFKMGPRAVRYARADVEEWLRQAREAGGGSAAS